MKKIIRIIFISLGILLILLLTLPVLFKSKIENLVKEEINKQVEAVVNWDKFSLNFFRGFPDLSINLHGLAVSGVEVFEADTLLALDRFELRVSPFTALKKELVIKSLILNEPMINGIVLEDGSANYDIAPASDSSDRKEEIEEEPEIAAETSEAPAFGVALKRFAIVNGQISYKDAPMALEADISKLDLELKGDFAMEETDLVIALLIDGINAKMGGVRYMRDGVIQVDIEAAAKLLENHFTLNKNEIKINDLVLGAEGSVELPDDGSIVTDIHFFTKETAFKTLLSLVPAVYLEDFESLETRGSLELDGTLKGVMKDSLLPDAKLNLAVKDGFFAYPDLPKNVSDIQISLDVDYKGSNMDATVVNLDRFHLLLGGNPFEIKLKADHPFSDPHVAGYVNGNIDFASLKDVIPLEDLELNGKLIADLNWDTKMSYIEQERYEEVDLDGSLIIEEVLLEAPDIPVPVKLSRMAMYFNPRFVNLETLDLVLGSSDLHVDGKLGNFIPYVFDNQTVNGSLNVASRLLDANELIPETEKDSTLKEESDANEDEIVEVPADSLAVPSQLKIPQNIDFRLRLDMAKIIYEDIVITDLAGIAEVKDGVATLDNLNMDILEGNVAVSGTVDTRNEFTEADVDLDLIGIDIPASYNTFVAIERLAPIAKHCKGKANVEMSLFTKLDASFNPLYESITSDGHLFARALKVEQPASLEKLAMTLKNENLKNLELDKADFRFHIRDGRINVDPFDINYGKSLVNISGSHGIDQTMNYLLDMNIARVDMGAAANNMMNSMSSLAGAAGFSISSGEFLKVKAKITGTFKDPKISTDLSGNTAETKQAVKETVTETVKEEIQKVEEDVREEASEKAEGLIKKAEEEKARLLDEAEKAGEKLKAEAKSQGDKLIQEAGNNPLKQIAAKKGAEELMNQANKQAEKLLEEAEIKGDQIIARAREEAEKI